MMTTILAVMAVVLAVLLWLAFLRHGWVHGGMNRIVLDESKRLDAMSQWLNRVDVTSERAFDSSRAAQNDLTRLNDHLAALMAHLGLAWETVPGKAAQPATAPTIRVVTVPRAKAKDGKAAGKAGAR
jgi:hypothetical protein